MLGSITRVFFAALLVAANSYAVDISGLVVAVSDGDTITVFTPEERQHKVRLLGIDAPEKAQPFGRKSKFSLSDLVLLKEVTVQTDQRDQYGHDLGKVTLDGRDINLVQIERGMAWWYMQYQWDQTPEDRKLYADAQAAAKAKKVGLWADKQAEPPWEFRRAIRRAQ